MRLVGTTLAMGLGTWYAAAQGVHVAPAARGSDATSIEAVAYADDVAAQSAWRPMAGSAPASAPVTLATVAGRQSLRMPCNFARTKTDRASWDKAVRLDLSEAESLRFQFLCRDRSPVSGFSFYLHSGQGWYSTSFGAFSSDSWTTVTIRKTDTRIEDRPGGWGAIDTIRISAWRGEDRDTEFFVRDVQATGGGSVVLVRGESLGAGPGDDLNTACQFSAVVAERLGETGIPFSTMSDLDLTAQRLEGKKLVILPYNPRLPQEAESLLVRFLQSGGKAITFYGMAPGLRAVAGIEGGRYVGQTVPGRFATIRPSQAAPLDGMPPVVAQASWNIMEAKAVPGRSRVVAEWYDQDGKPTGDAAIVVSDNCIQMTHVLLADDPPGKRRLILAMAGTLVPELWPVAASHSLERIGWLGSHQGLAEARKIAEAQGTPPEAIANVREALALGDQARKSYDGKRYAEAIATTEEANRKCTLAYCHLEKPAPIVVRASRLPSVPSEHRAFWCHSALGVAGMDWDQAIKTLADNGFTAILPNMMWGATAYYPSDVLPVAPEVATRGDQVAQCLAACRKYGVACHVWKVCWNMGGHTPAEFVQRMKNEGRTQVAFDGKADDQWLCPSSSLNRQQEIDAMVEVATKYDVDGVHFDYIRYPGPDGCFCAACREGFEKSIGAKVANWPADLRSDVHLAEQWGDYRRANITAVVAGVSERLRKTRPKVKISAAVFANWPGDRNRVGQDWKVWCDRAYLDFVCPMDYTANSQEFAAMVAQQVQWAGRVPCYPGIGLSASGGGFDVFTLFEQIAAARRAGTGGFTIFNYGPQEARDIVPLCGMGITRKE